MRVHTDDEETVRIARRPRRARGRRGLAAAAAAGLAAVACAGWFAVREPPPVSGPAIVHRAADLTIPSGDEQEILAASTQELRLFRFRDMPRVLVLSFPSLAEQGRTLNRLGAFAEKAGLPHDRVLADAELAGAIRQAGDTEETYYYGHDYAAADLARFFDAAARDGVALRPEEERLRALLERAGVLDPAAPGAVISIPPLSRTPTVDAGARATILHHELSHGLFFTDPAYAAYARSFWRTVLSEAERAGFRRFLGSEGYDTSNEELMLNEAQAYLIHTPDPAFFRPELAGLTEAEAAQLRRAFVAGMPPSWLKDADQRQIAMTPHP